MGVHGPMSVWDRPRIKRLYDLLADGRPPRGSDAADRQSEVTAHLNELHEALVPRQQQPVGIRVQRRQVPA